MTVPSDSPPLDRLLTEPRDIYEVDGAALVAELGLTPEHIDDLCRMVGNASLYESEDGTAWQAPFLACHALGALRAVETVPSILDAVDRFDDFFEFWYEALPDILRPLGVELLPALTARLRDQAAGLTSRQVVAGLLADLGQAFPDVRDRCVASLTGYLAEHRHADFDDLVANGTAISALVDLKATESAEVIEAAFAAGVVDESIRGDWEYVRYDLGLGPPPVRPTDRAVARLLASRSLDRPGKRPDPTKLAKRQAQARKKQRRKRR